MQQYFSKNDLAFPQHQSVNPFDFCFSIFVFPLFSLYLSLCLPLSVIFLVYNPTFFRPARLYELLLYLNFRIVLERVKQKEEYDKL